MDIESKLQEIDGEVKNTPAILYMKGSKDFPMCGFSGQVVNILNHIGAEYETRDVLQDQALRQAIKVYGNWPTIPQLYVKGKLVGGCDIITELHESGELQSIIDSAPTSE